MNEDKQNGIEEVLTFVDLALDDLTQLAKYDPSIYEELYYNRDDEADELITYLSKAKADRSNILITGEAGIGKTSFVHKIVMCKTVTKQLAIYPIILDFRDIIAMDTEAVLLQFANKMQRYFSDIGSPINTLDFSEPFRIKYNLTELKEHLCSLDFDTINKHLVLFVDDLDYADGQWFDILRYILPFASSPFMTMVLSVRPHLLDSIIHSDDRFRQHYVRRVHRIDLEPLQVKKVVSARIAPLLKKKANNPFHSFIDRLFGRETKICMIARKLGINDIETLPRFDFPISDNTALFIRQISNGNLRDIFAMAVEVISFALNNKSTLSFESEDDIFKPILSPEIIIEIFKPVDKTNKRYFLYNLNRRKSRSSGNSLHYNVLQAVKILGFPDSEFYTLLKRLGHSKTDVDYSLSRLEDKLHRMIFKKIVFPGSAPKHLQENEYLITPKGELYLEMASSWAAYQTEFGKPGKSLEDIL